MNNSKQASASRDALRVLMQIRPNAFSQRGGDTVVLEQLRALLEQRGVSVVVDAQSAQDPAAFDVVHLFNFATPDCTRAQAERAKAAGVPYVVTTLLEDVQSFHHQSHAMAQVLMQYIERGQDPGYWSENRELWRSVPPSGSFDNKWIAENAAALLTTGAGESKVLRRLYPNSAQVIEMPLAIEQVASTSPELFVQTYGVRDFVLCVGRLETRKNQLMLLKALEESDLPVVLVSGGVSYQPEYANAVRSFRRRGSTLVLDRLTPEMLASAYAACRVHVLASWYELPGLVSLEAAAHGRNVVVSDTGSTKDYLGEEAFYCVPYDEQSIVNAVMAAFYAPARPELQRRVQQYTWARSVDCLYDVYRSVQQPKGGVMQSKSQAAAESAASFIELLEQGEAAAKAQEFDRAETLLSQAAQIDPAHPRCTRAQGAVAYARGDVRRARALFQRAVDLDPSESKSWSGIALCEMSEGSVERAHAALREAVRLAPESLVAIRQLIECAYHLDRYDALEEALREYLARHPDDYEIQFCLAGCLYKRGQIAEARAVNEQVLREHAGHQGASQLAELLAQPMAEQSETQSSAPEQGARERSTEGLQSSVQSGPAFGPIDVELNELESEKRSGRFALVESRGRKLCERSDLSVPQRERARLLVAEAIVLQGRLDEARPMFEKLLEENPRSARALCGMAAIAAHEQRWDEARERFSRASGYEPNYDVPWAGLGLCSMHAGAREEAWSYFERAVQCNPENTRALLGILELGYELGRLDRVQMALEGYLELHPADVEFLYSLAGCYFAQNKLNEAAREVEKITLFEPNHRSALELRDMIGARMQQPSAAS